MFAAGDGRNPRLGPIPPRRKFRADGKINRHPMRSIRTRDWKLIPNLTPDATYTTHIDLAPRENKPDNWGTYGES